MLRQEGVELERRRRRRRLLLQRRRARHRVLERHRRHVTIFDRRGVSVFSRDVAILSGAAPCSGCEVAILGCPGGVSVFNGNVSIFTRSVLHLV